LVSLIMAPIVVRYSGISVASGVVVVILLALLWWAISRSKKAVPPMKDPVEVSARA